MSHVLFASTRDLVTVVYQLSDVTIVKQKGGGFGSVRRGRNSELTDNSISSHGVEQPLANN